jgi:hypothetical protein
METQVSDTDFNLCARERSVEVFPIGMLSRMRDGNGMGRGEDVFLHGLVSLF